MCMQYGYPKGTAVNWLIDLTFLIFLNAAECEFLCHMVRSLWTIISIIVVMILRVYAMWSRSKRILCLLQFIYVPQVIVTSVLAVVYNTGTYLSGMAQINFTCHSNLTQVAIHLLLSFSPVTILSVMDFSVCNVSWSNTPLMPAVYEEIPRCVLSATLLILAITQTLKESINMYKATKHWQPNRYMQRLVRDGIIYFLVYVFRFPLSLLSICHHHVHPPILLLSICGQTNHLVFPSEIIGTYCSIFHFWSGTRMPETSLQSTSWSCFVRQHCAL